MWIKCTKCGRYKALWDFNKNKKGRFGILKQCKACRKALDKEYIQDNYEDKQRRDRDYRLNNAEKISARQRKYRIDNIETIKKNDKERYKKYYANNKDGYAKRTALRRAIKKQQSPPLTQEEQCLMKKYYKVCKLLGTEKYHVDHIKALNNGGLHHPSNLQIITVEDNLSKSDKEFYTYKHPKITLKEDIGT